MLGGSDPRQTQLAPDTVFMPEPSIKEKGFIEFY